MGKPTAPTPPDAQQLTGLQTASNLQTANATARLNATNQVTPDGSLTYTAGPVDANGVPQWTATQTLSPAGQKLHDTGLVTAQNIADLGRDQSARIGGLLAKPIDLSALPAAGNPMAKDYSADRQRVEDAMFGELDTQSNRDLETLTARLANQGIKVGSDAFTRATGDFQKGRAADRTAAILNAGQEQSRLVGLDDSAFNRSQAARAAGLNETFALRNQPINEILALAGMGGVTAPSFAGTPQVGVAGTDVAGIANQQFANANSIYQNQVTQQNQLIGGLAGAAGNLFRLSDERIKHDIEDTGEETEDGIPIKAFRYDWEGDETPKHVGVMAQEAEKVRPDAVATLRGGVKAVNYAKIGGF